MYNSKSYLSVTCSFHRIISMSSERKTIICDIGTGFLKLGYAGENFPRTTFPTIVGRPILRSGNVSTFSKNIFEKDIIVGDLCDTNEGALDTVFPVRNGVITDEENMNHIWDFCFGDALFRASVDDKGIPKLNLEEKPTDFSEHSILLTEAAENPVENRVKLFRTMFERYGFGRAMVVPQAILTLYAQGLTTGLVLDSGDGVSHAMPVFKSYLVSSSVRRLNVAGSHITTRLIRLLQLAGYYLNSSADSVLARKIKEKLCFIAGNLERTKALEEETGVLRAEYKLQNGDSIFLEKERYLAPECLFQPNYIGNAQKGVHETVFDCVTAQSTNISIRKPLFSHIVLSGGTTMLRGFPTRLEKELAELITDRILAGNEERLKAFKLRIEDPPRRKIMVFHGASLYAKIVDNQHSLWISKKDWEEQGENIVKK